MRKMSPGSTAGLNISVQKFLSVVQKNLCLHFHFGGIPSASNCVNLGKNLSESLDRVQFFPILQNQV